MKYFSDRFPDPPMWSRIYDAFPFLKEANLAPLRVANVIREEVCNATVIVRNVRFQD